MSRQRNLIKVIPPKGKENQLLLTQGTKVFVGDTEVDGVVSIQLIAEIGQPWKAVITTHVEEIDTIVAEQTGDTILEVTALEDESRYYEKVQLLKDNQD